MNFSDYFGINEQLIEDYGAVNINFICDLPLFIDPMLIFNSQKPEYRELHNSIIQYFHFLAKKSELGFTTGDLSTFLDFSEIKNNWFGYSKSGNEGNGNGDEFARFFAKNIKFALQNNNISSGVHFEKALLLFPGNGRDKISDLTTHLILDYLAKYTQNFAIANIDKKHLDTFYLDSKFNYATETFESIEYTLPYIINKKGQQEFVILTPKDILRKGEPAINRADLLKRISKVRNSISDESIRSQLENYICKAVVAYENECRVAKKKIKESVIAKIEKDAFINALQNIPEIYDYYIKMKENEKEEVNAEAFKEMVEQIEKFYNNSAEFIRLYKENFPYAIEGATARDEAKQRILYFKHIIEDCDGYKILYYNGQPISKEDDLQRLFRFVWYGSQYDGDYDANNGRGEYDVKVSFGAKDKNISEFKLASNSKLSHVFDQVAIYEKANQCKDSLIVIFYFSADELVKVKKMLAERKKEDLVGESIFLIDCRSDNKISASKV